VQLKTSGGSNPGPEGRGPWRGPRGRCSLKLTLLVRK